MHEMKFDMIGGATVLAVLQVASDLQLPLRVVGIIAASENMPSGKALKPGDVVKTYSGQTVEVINTDAEGRMVLADGLTYVERQFKPNLIIDVATLTGSVAVALGNKITGAVGNNDKINQKFSLASKTTGEDLHFLPFYPGYNDELKSSVADFTNIGKQRVDALVSALFLSKFIDKQTPWIHLDIAGTAWNNEGPTGVMLKTLLAFIKSLPKR
jgi:leucyl aminopeptidase